MSYLTMGDLGQTGYEATQQRLAEEAEQFERYRQASARGQSFSQWRRAEATKAAKRAQSRDRLLKEFGIEPVQGTEEGAYQGLKQRIETEWRNSGGKGSLADFVRKRRREEAQKRAAKKREMAAEKQAGRVERAKEAKAAKAARARYKTLEPQPRQGPTSWAEAARALAPTPGQWGGPIRYESPGAAQAYAYATGWKGPRPLMGLGQRVPYDPRVVERVWGFPGPEPFAMGGMGRVVAQGTPLAYPGTNFVVFHPTRETFSLEQRGMSGCDGLG